MIERREHDQVLELRLDRPPVNALSPELVAALADELREAEEAGAAALVLSGRGGMFTAGLDVPALLGLDREGIRAAWADLTGLLSALARTPMPVAAALTGHAPAGGAVLAIHCDHRVMARGDFRVGLNEVRVGIPLPPTIHRVLARQVGSRQAERLGVAGLMLDAEEARRIGLVDELRPPEEVVPAAVAWCRELLALPRRAMLETRRTARRDLVEAARPPEPGELDELVEMWFSEETQEALVALVEKLKSKKGIPS